MPLDNRREIIGKVRRCACLDSPIATLRFFVLQKTGYVSAVWVLVALLRG